MATTKMKGIKEKIMIKKKKKKDRITPLMDSPA